MTDVATPQRTAIVTGASSGIGAAIALTLGRSGWRVGIGARRREPLADVAAAIVEAGGTVLAHPLDVALDDSIDGFVELVEAEFGAIDAVVSNAGVSLPGLVHELSLDDLDSEIAINLRAPIVLARRVLPAMLERGSGDLVFVSSENAVVPRTFQAGYTATKMGLEGLARVLRMELEGTGIRSTIVRPGPTETAFGRDWDAALIQRILQSWKEWGVQRHYDWLPPESVANAVAAALDAPPGTHLDVIQVMPERLRR